MTIHLGIYDGPTGALLLDATARGARGIRASTNARGFERLDADIPLTLDEAYQLWAGAIPWAVLRANGQVIFEGRLADPELSVATETGLRIRAYGAWDALSDLPYIALWSTTSLAGWFRMTAAMSAGRVPESFDLTTDNALLLAALKGSSQTNSVVGQLVYAIPDGSTRLIQNVSFTYTFLDTEGNYNAGLQAFTAASPVAGAWPFIGTVWGSLTATTAVDLVQCVSLPTPASGIGFYLFRNAAAANNANETEQNSLRITDIRITTTPLLVDTVMTVVVFSGDTTITVASVANIQVGMILIIQKTAGTPGGERVQVASIAGLVLTLTGPVAFGYSVGANQVRAQWVDAADIATDIISAVSTLNSAQLSSSTAGIDPTLNLPDLSDQVYEDQDIGSVLTQLAFLGDASRQQLESGVWEDRRLVLRAQGAAARTWFPTASGFRARRALGSMANSVYAIYEDATGRPVRTAVATNTSSVLANNLTRRRGVRADTTSATEAIGTRDTALADTAKPLPEAEYTISDVQDGGGGLLPNWMPRAGDTATFRVIPSGFGAAVDQLRTVRISRTDYDADSNTMDIEPEAPIASLDVELARSGAGLDGAPLPIRELSRTPVIVLT